MVNKRSRAGRLAHRVICTKNRSLGNERYVRRVYDGCQIDRLKDLVAENIEEDTVEKETKKM